MKVRHLNLVCIGLAATVAIEWPARVVAQENGFGIEPAEIVADKLFPDSTRESADTYVDDSFEVQELLAELDVQQRRGGWAEAGRIVEELLTVHGDRLTRIGDGAYVTTIKRVNRMIGDWPAEGRDAYHAALDASAKRAFDSARAERDVRSMAAAVERFLWSTDSVAAALETSEWATESGAFGLARWCCTLLLGRGDLELGEESDLIGRLAILWALAGDESEAQNWLGRADSLSSGATVRWEGRTESLAAVVKSILSDEALARSTSGREGWPIPGVGGTGPGRADFRVDSMALMWRFPGSEGARIGRLFDSRDTSEPVLADSTAPSPSQPVVAKGIVVVQRVGEILAFKADSGALLWRYEVSDRTSSSNEDDSNSIWLSPTISGGKIYACVGEESYSYFGYDPAVSQGFVVCLDLLSGTELWRKEKAALGEAFAKMNLGSSPVISGDTVAVMGRLRRTFGFEDCYVLRFRATDGQFIGQTHIGSGSTGGFGNRRPDHSIAAVRDETLYATSHLGSIAAVSIATGGVEWLRVYKRRPADPWRTTLRSEEEGIQSWQFDPLYCTDDAVVCRPMDSDCVWVLDRQSGELRRCIGLEGVSGWSGLLDVVDERLYGVGQQAFCFELRDGSMLWSAPLPEGEVVRGRGVLTATGMLVPLQASLVQFELNDGRRTLEPWAQFGATGNLLVTDDALIVAGRDHLTAFGRELDVSVRLSKWMQQRPDDPEPALDLAELRFYAADLEGARAALEEAILRGSRKSFSLDSNLRKRMFRACLSLASGWTMKTDHDLNTIASFFDWARQCAGDTQSHVQVRFQQASFLAEHGLPARAVEVYQQVLNDRSLRLARLDEVGRQSSAGAAAHRKMAELIALYGREVYVQFDEQATVMFNAARSTQDLPLLDRMIETHSLATILPDAMAFKAELLRQRGEFMEAARTYMSLLSRFRKDVDAPQIMQRISDCYREVGRSEQAWRWLSKAVAEFPEARIRVGGETLRLAEYCLRLEVERAFSSDRFPSARGPFAHSYEYSFSENVELLVPSLVPSADSDWSSVYLYGDGQVYALDASHGKLQWQTEVDHRPELQTVLTYGVIFATRHQVFALDRSSGQKLWSIGEHPIVMDEPEGDHEAFPGFFCHGQHFDRLFSIREDGRATCTNLKDGVVLWNHALTHRPVGRLVVSDEFLVYPGSQATDSAVYVVLDVLTGEWLRAIEPSASHSRALTATPDGQLVVASSFALESYDLSNGNLRWQSPTRDRIIDSSIVADLEGIVYADETGRVNKFNLIDGSLSWQSEPISFLGNERLHSQILGNQVMFGSSRGVLSIDSLNGRLLWERRSGQTSRFIYHGLSISHWISVEEEDDEHRFIIVLDLITGQSSQQTGQTAIDLGDVRDVRAIQIRDNAIVVQDGRNIRGLVSVAADE